MSCGFGSFFGFFGTSYSKTILESTSLAVMFGMVKWHCLWILVPVCTCKMYSCAFDFPAESCIISWRRHQMFKRWELAVFDSRFFFFLFLMCYSPRGITMVTVGARYIRGANLQVEVLSEMFLNYWVKMNEQRKFLERWGYVTKQKWIKSAVWMKEG